MNIDPFHFNLSPAFGLHHLSIHDAVSIAAIKSAMHSHQDRCSLLTSPQ
jgi:hypothetical protein